MRWSQDQLDAYLTRQAEATEALRDALCDAVDPGPESNLRSKIVAWGKEWAKPCL